MLKYRIVVDHGFLLTCWHESNPNQFCYVTRRGCAAFIDFDFAYDFHDGIVLSIVGSTVRVTDLKAAPIPPPMCHYELNFPNTVCEVAQLDGQAAFLLADQSLYLYKLRDGKFERSDEYDTSVLPSNCICYNLVLNDASAISAIVASSSCALYSLTLKNHNKGVCLYSSEKPFIWHSYTTDGFILQQIDGRWLSLTKEYGKDVLVAAERSCTVINVLGHCRFVPNRNSYFGISKGFDLVVNGRSVLRYVGSYSIDQNYLLAITFATQTASSKLQIAKLEEVVAAGKELNCKRGRAVERGAMLIGFDADGTRVWLQMPRGNLETIYLRELQLNKLKELLKTLRFKEAALMMKKHRIDMNLFYDNDPALFVRHIGRFVDDINNAELLNLFVASLNNDNVTEGMYGDSYSDSRVHRAIKNGKTKVQIVCTALRDHILNLDETRINELYTTILSTYLKEKPPQIPEALLDLRERSSKLDNGVEMEQKWIAFVSLLAPNEDLFKVALSTYDLGLAHAVVQNLQIDPKEYLPLIAEFRAHSPLAYQKFKIDVYLGKFERAIGNISELDDRWDEAAEIIKRHNLYSEALAIYRGKSTYMKTCELCANYLMGKRRFEEAALLFKRVGDLTHAVECYQSVHNWKRVVECGQMMNMEREVLEDMLMRMIRYFENSRNFRDVAEILSFVDKKANEVKILESYCEAGVWDSAVSFAAGREGLMEIINEKACARCDQILQNVENWSSLLEQYTSRLEVVRQKKKNSLNSAMEKSAANDDSMSDVFSDVSTTMSDMSKISGASTASARRRKHVEKKKKVLKEGSQYEDAALLNAIKDTVSLIDTQQDELVPLLPALVAVDAVKEARTLQTRFLALMNRTSKAVEAAWPAYIYPHIIPGPLREIYRGEDGVIRVPDENGMPARISLESELMRPQLRMNVLWQLEICK